jgi:hypothetical protein
MTSRTIVLVVAIAVMALIHQAGGQGSPGQQAPASTDARVLSQEELQAASELPPADRGATYYFLEGLATRATARFSDGVAVAERAADGRLVVRVRDASERDVAGATLNRITDSLAVLDYRLDGDESVPLAVRREDARPTLDWAARQTYQLWKEHGGKPSGLKWEDGFMRAAGARPANRGHEPLEVHTEWRDGIAAIATLKSARRPHLETGRLIDGHALETRFLKHGVYSGGVVWYPEERTVSWSFPGLTQGYVDPDRLAPVGGWAFTPDLAWANVQAFAFDHFHTLISRNRFVAERRPGLIEKLVEGVIPTLEANEVGCDNLHWLDRTVYRPCCDVHDRCYSKYACTSRSWWRWWTSWRCDYCNVNAVFCFSSGGSRGLPPLAY